MDKQHGIIGQIYYLLKEHGIYNSTENFFVELFQCEETRDAIYSNEKEPEATNTVNSFSGVKFSNISQFDFLDTNTFKDTDKLLSDAKAYQSKIECRLGNLPASEENIINRKLIQILDNISIYAIKRCPKAQEDFKNYDTKCISLLRVYFLQKKDFFDLSYNIFLLIYFAVYKHLPADFFYGSDYKKDLKEFNETVICKYGVTSSPGVRAIIALAEREKPNIFALYEYADMLYYGNLNGPQKDLYKAFHTYQKAAGLNRINHIIESTCNPLALWSLAFIYFNYRNSSSPELGHFPVGTIPELDSLSKLEKIEGATHYALAAFQLTEDAPSANLLGRITSIREDELPGIARIKQKYSLNSSEEYFKYASEQGYVYATNNLANTELEQIFNTSDNLCTHIERYISLLKLSAEKYEPWAANSLGEIYRTGEIKNRKTNQSIPYKTDSQLANKYYHLAIDYFNDINSAWAYANLIVYYPEEYINNYQRFVQHNEKIEKLKNARARELVNEHLLDTYCNYPEILRVYKNIYTTTNKEVKVK
jgi:TPR repeat protein